MAGVNLNEESARILATSSELVGTKIRSCKDESFLPAGLLHRRILDTGTSTCLRRLLGRRRTEGFPQNPTCSRSNLLDASVGCSSESASLLS